MKFENLWLWYDEAVKSLNHGMVKFDNCRFLCGDVWDIPIMV